MQMLVSLNTALASPLQTAQGVVSSGIAKRPREGAVALGPLGLEGDEQVDLRYHGGPSRAVYGYPSEHYGFWQTVRAQAGVGGWGQVLPPGSLGENLTLTGLVEDDAFVGDQLRFENGCVLAVSEPRYPCFKFNAVMGFKQAAKLMMQSGWCGYYLAVIEGGALAAGERFELIPGPREVNLRELFKARTAGKTAD